MTRRVAVCLAVVLLFRGVAAAENLVSGPQVGEKVSGDFRVLFVETETTITVTDIGPRGGQTGDLTGALMALLEIAALTAFMVFV